MHSSMLYKSEEIGASMFGRGRYIKATMAEQQVQSTDFLHDASAYVSTINYALIIAIFFRFCARISSSKTIKITATNFLFSSCAASWKAENIYLTLLVSLISYGKWFSHNLFLLLHTLIFVPPSFY